LASPSNPPWGRGHSRNWTQLTHLHQNQKKKKTNTSSLVSCARTSDFVFLGQLFWFLQPKQFGKFWNFAIRNFFLSKIENIFLNFSIKKSPIFLCQKLKKKKKKKKQYLWKKPKF